MTMEVKLLNYNPTPARTIWIAARTCYSAETPQEIADKLDVKQWYDTKDRLFAESEEFMKLFDHLHTSGHHSVFEHVDYTFMISGITRQTTHQLVRHRHFRYSQQSMRYVKMENAKFDVPLNDRYFYSEFDESALDIVKEEYGRLLDQGTPPEDARRILPIGTKTNIVVSGNLRALMHFMSERRCVLAQKEINRMATAMMKAVREVHPVISRVLMIKCERLGYCPEERNKYNKICDIREHPVQLVNGVDIANLIIIKEERRSVRDNDS